jgi:NhaC family Na+:H+ antiporter
VAFIGIAGGLNIPLDQAAGAIVGGAYFGDKLSPFSDTTNLAPVALMTGSSFLSILIPGELFAPAYRKFNLAAKNLSRTTEDSGTVIVPLAPWSIAGVFMAGTLGVDTLAYAPWAIMCYVGFMFALFYGFTGIAIAPRINEDETTPGS